MNEELSLALKKSPNWTSEQRRRDLMNGFGKGESWGAHCLATFFPAWFQKVWKDLNWLNTGLISGEVAFWHLIEAYGWNQEKFFQFSKLFLPIQKQENRCNLDFADKWYAYEDKGRKKYEAEYNGLY